MKKILSAIIALSLMLSMVTFAQAAETNEVTYPRAVYEQNFDDKASATFTSSLKAPLEETAVFGKTNFDTSVAIDSAAYWIHKFVVPQSTATVVGDSEYQHVSYKFAVNKFGLTNLHLELGWTDGNGNFKTSSTGVGWTDNASYVMYFGTKANNSLFYPGMWHQLDYVYSKAAKTVKIYMDGVLKYTLDSSTFTAPTGYETYSFSGISGVYFEDRVARRVYLDDFKSEILNADYVPTTEDTLRKPINFSFDHVTGVTSNMLYAGTLRAYNNYTSISEFAGTHFKGEIAAGLGGKAADDMSIRFYNAAATDDTTINSATYLKLYTNSLITQTPAAGEKFQISYDVYLDEMNASSSEAFIVTLNQQSIGLSVFRNNKEEVSGATGLEYNTWHKVAHDMTVTESGTLLDKIYVDGKYMAEKEWGATAITQMDILWQSHKDAKTAKSAAIDNILFDISSAADAPSYEEVTLSSETVQCDNANLSIATFDHTMTVGGLLDALTIATGEAQLYARLSDGSAADADEIAANASIVAVPEMGAEKAYAVRSYPDAWFDTDFTTDTMVKETNYIYYKGGVAAGRSSSIQLANVSDAEKFSFTKEDAFGYKKTGDYSYVLRGTGVSDAADALWRIYPPSLTKNVVIENEFYLDKAGITITAFAQSSPAVSTNVVSLGSNKVSSLLDKDVTGSYKDGEWVKVAVELNSDTNKVSVYINGEKLVDNVDLFTGDGNISTFKTNGLKEIRIFAGAQADNFVAGFDNMKVYQGTYDYSADSLSLSNADSFGIVAADEEEGINIDDLTASAGAEVAIFGEEADYAYPGDVIAVYGDRVMKLYRVANELALTNLSDSANKVVELQLTAADAAGKLYLAEYSGGRLVNVVSKDTNALGYAKIITDVTDGNTYSAFVWNANLAPLTESAGIN